MPIWRDLVKALSTSPKTEPSKHTPPHKGPGAHKGPVYDPALPVGGRPGQPVDLDESPTDDNTGVVAFGQGDRAQVFTDLPFAIVVTLGDRKPLPQDPLDPGVVKLPFGTQGVVRAAGPEYVWLDVSQTYPNLKLVKLHRRDLRNTTPVQNRRRWAQVTAPRTAQTQQMVWRVENAEGRGPHTDPKGHEVIINTKEDNLEPIWERRPEPQYDFDDDELHEGGYEVRRGIGGFTRPIEGVPQALFAFATKEDAIRWFGPKTLEALRAVGFELKQVPASKVWQKPKARQVMFMRSAQIETDPEPAYDVQVWHQVLEPEDYDAERETLVVSGPLNREDLVALLRELGLTVAPEREDADNYSAVMVARPGESFEVEGLKYRYVCRLAQNGQPIDDTTRDSLFAEAQSTAQTRQATHKRVAGLDPKAQKDLLRYWGLEGLTSGTPVTLYHGTTAQKFSAFSLDKNRDALVTKFFGRGLFFTPDKSVAWKYAYAARNMSQLPRSIIDELRARNPSAAEFMRIMHEQGYDGDTWLNFYTAHNLLSANGQIDKQKETELFGGLDPQTIADVAEYIEGAKQPGGVPDMGEEIVAVMHGTKAGGLPNWVFQSLAQLGLDPNEYAPKVVTVQVVAQKPLVTDDQTEAKNAQTKGYDSLVVVSHEALVDGVPEVAVFDASKVRVVDIEVADVVARTAQTRQAMPMPVALPDGWQIVSQDRLLNGKRKPKPGELVLGMSRDYTMVDKKGKPQAVLSTTLVDLDPPTWQFDSVKASAPGSGWGAFIQNHALREISRAGGQAQPDDSLSESGQRFWSKLYDRVQAGDTKVSRTPLNEPRQIVRNVIDRTPEERAKFWSQIPIGDEGNFVKPLVDTPDVQARYRLVDAQRRDAALGPALALSLGLMGTPGTEPEVKPHASDSSAYASRASTYRELVDAVATAEGVDPKVIHAMIRAESGYTHSQTSAKGAVGIMQTTPITAKQMGVPVPETPHESVSLGVKYFKYLLRMFKGNLELALAAYNRGPTAVKESLAQRGQAPQTPETVNYVRRVLRELGQRPVYYADTQ